MSMAGCSLQKWIPTLPDQDGHYWFRYKILDPITLKNYLSEPEMVKVEGNNLWGFFTGDCPKKWTELNSEDKRYQWWSDYEFQGPMEVPK